MCVSVYVCVGGSAVAMDTSVCGKQSKHDRVEFTDSRWLGWGQSSSQPRDNGRSISANGGHMKQD